MCENQAEVHISELYWEPARREWVRDHGSDLLKQLQNDFDETYVEERVRKERPGWKRASRVCGALTRISDPNEELVAALQVMGAQVKVALLRDRFEPNHLPACRHSLDPKDLRYEEFQEREVFHEDFLGETIIREIRDDAKVLRDTAQWSEDYQRRLVEFRSLRDTGILGVLDLSGVGRSEMDDQVEKKDSEHSIEVAPEVGDTEHVIYRDGKPNLRFVGRMLGEVQNSSIQANPRFSGSVGSWQELRVYMTVGGQYVCQEIKYEVGCDKPEFSKSRVVVRKEKKQLIEFFGWSQWAKELYGLLDLDTCEDI